MESVMEAHAAILEPQMEMAAPATEPRLELVKTVPSEKEARQSIAAFFKAVSNGHMKAAEQHLVQVADFARHSQNQTAVQDILLTGFTAAAGIEGNRERTTAELGYAVHTPLKQQLMAFGKK